MVHEYAHGHRAPVARSVPADGDSMSDPTRRMRDEEQQSTSPTRRTAPRERLVGGHRDKLEQLADDAARQRGARARRHRARSWRDAPRLERAPGVGLRVVAARPADPGA